MLACACICAEGRQGDRGGEERENIIEKNTSHNIYMYWVVREIPIFDRTGLNISERLKTNNMRTLHIIKVLQAYLEKIWLRYVNFCQFYTPLNMEENKVHLMLFFYRKGKNATQVANKICLWRKC